MANPDAEADHKQSSQRTNSQSVIEQALRSNLHELRRLAVFYHKRGKTEQARELYHMMIAIQQRLDADDEAIQKLLESSPDSIDSLEAISLPLAGGGDEVFTERFGSETDDLQHS